MNREHPLLLRLGATVRSLRKARGLTQAALGQRIGVKQARMAPLAAFSMSASSSTIMAFLPPSSSETSRGPVSIAAAATLRPVGTEPVKLTAPTPGWVVTCS